MKSQQQIQCILEQDLESLKNYNQDHHTVQAKTRLEQWRLQLEEGLNSLDQTSSLSSESVNQLLEEISAEIEHCKAKLRNLGIQADWRFDYYRFMRGLRYDVLTLKELVAHSHQPNDKYKKKAQSID